MFMSGGTAGAQLPGGFKHPPQEAAASSWHSEELDKVSSEKGAHTHHSLQHKGQIEPAQTLFAPFRAGPRSTEHD